MQPPNRCIACDHAPRAAERVGRVRLLRCPRCRLAWWRWPAFAAEDFYDRDYFQGTSAAKGYRDYAALEAGLLRTAAARLATLRRLGHAGGRLLDVGCGTGVFLDAARRKGWTVRGIEPSPFAAGQARGRGHDVAAVAIERGLDQVDPNQDCITLWDCIEHLPDPRGTLAGLAGRLRPGGLLALSTGDVTSLCARWSGRRWHLYNFPEHLFFFSPQALRLLLARAGCRVIRIRREVNWVTSGYIAERLGKTLAGRADAGHAGGLLLPATLGDVLGVYAVRERQPGQQVTR